MPSIQTSSLRFHLQTTVATDNAASAQSAAVPAPAVAVEVGTVNQVDPEKVNQLTQAVAEQVRALAALNTLLI